MSALITNAMLIASMMSAIGWLIAICLARPSIARIWRGDTIAGDDIRSTLALLAFNILWFNARKYVFGHHADVMTEPEMIWLACCNIFSLVCAVLVCRIVRAAVV